MSKFTPGPWEATNASIKNGVDSAVHAANIAVVGYCWNGHAEEIQANRNLIAAAPEMYDALKAAIDHITDLHDAFTDLKDLGVMIHLCGSTYDENKARAALAKAEGGAQ